jgi:hypothetical protein
MSEALTVIDPVVSSVHLIARNPVEMQNAQADLAVWLKNKVIESKIEIGELGAALAEARTNGWSLTALTRQRNKAVGQFKFYEKILAAVEAGYTIIPEFPIDVFAIRVTRASVRRDESTTTANWNPDIPDQRPDVAGLGEGEYKNPVPLVRQGSYPDKRKDGTEATVRFTQASRFQNEIVFPLRAARPTVMSATAEAMALKVFDQIGICEPRSVAAGIQRKGDPLIIGQILGRREGWTQKCVSFIIAWHLDLRTL